MGVRSLDGGPKCRMSILRNGNVACPCRLVLPMSHVEFRKSDVTCHYDFKPMLHVTKPCVACQI